MVLTTFTITTLMPVYRAIRAAKLEDSEDIDLPYIATPSQLSSDDDSKGFSQNVS